MTTPSKQPPSPARKVPDASVEIAGLSPPLPLAIFNAMAIYLGFIAASEALPDLFGPMISRLPLLVVPILKTLPIWMLLFHVLARPVHDGFSLGMAFGLAASSIGDMALALELDERYFLAGLGAFFVAHVLYSLAIISDDDLSNFSGFMALLSGGIALGAAALVLPLFIYHVPMEMRMHVLAYCAVIIVTLWRALARFTTDLSDAQYRAAGKPTKATSSYVRRGSAATALGAAFFVLSDSLLAYNRFAQPFRFSHFLVMLTYYSAQALLAGSARADNYRIAPGAQVLNPVRQ
ncbi:hypothetical protein H696_04345 [Fonticula alba]|uniref:Lysoplasmalogenase n=1 Tax=Fonticula alba TaxID=691883 RepID=A0A058Z3U8_FONAL|nr:hypothetical protein H696_04345 [Fonticula alba]KCV68925.1 hypothetical protein H696_04345 [Fonticula alba]|eukprot:XP_009496496.1 hypothetical protein H696_04345 [Fonticula alba]